jgi:hypothetical protein
MLRIVCMAMSIANATFSLATPIDYTHHVLSAQAHNLPQYVDKGRQLHRDHLSIVIMLIDMDADAVLYRVLV